MEPTTKLHIPIGIHASDEPRMEVLVQDGDIVDVQKITLDIPTSIRCSKCVLVTRFNGKTCFVQLNPLLSNILLMLTRLHWGLFVN